MADQGVSFSDQVRAVAKQLGFEAVGIARASAPLDHDFGRYQAFVREGMHGEMGWLARDERLRERLDGEGILAGAKSVICVARRYPHHGLEAPRGDSSHASSLRIDPSAVDSQVASSLPVGSLAASSSAVDSRDAASPAEMVPAIARYARGRDYHRFLRRRLRRLATFVRSLGTQDQPVRARPLCDEEPVLERAWAVRSGLGFVGKNGLVIVPGLGSMVLLGEVVTTLDLEPGERGERGERLEAGVPAQEPLEARCGTCTRCLDACPTSAFRAPFVLDPRRCVSYLTIELRGAIPGELREGVGAHLFGCDDCQTVCPFNAGTGARAPLDRSDGDPFAPLERWSRVRLASLLSLDAASWRELFEGTPLRRVGRAGIARNAAIVLGNRRDGAALTALRVAASDHDDAVVRDAAAWAVGRIEAAR